MSCGWTWTAHRHRLGPAAGGAHWSSALSRLCAWVLQADKQGLDYGLRLGGRRSRRPAARRTSGAAWKLWPYGNAGPGLPAMLERLTALPRDTRDTLFLLLVIAWVHGAAGWATCRCGAALLAAVLAVARRAGLAGRPLPSRWWLLGLLVLTVGATLLTHKTLLGRDAGVTLIVVLLALKTLELRARRDAFVVFFLSFFTMLTNFFFSQSLLTAWPCWWR
jgi:hypothetical protein